MQSVRTDGESFRAQPALVFSKDTPSFVTPAQSDRYKDGEPLPRTIDSDGDGVADAEDNCMSTYNPRQEDADGDGSGDVCDVECKKIYARIVDDVGVGDDMIDYGFPESMYIRTEARPGAEKYALFQFEQLDVPSDAVIQSAYVFFFTLPVENRASLEIHRILTPWDEKTALGMTWGPEKGYFDPQPSATFYAPGGFAAADLQDLVQRWVLGTFDNYGFLVAESEPGTVHYFASSETPFIEMQPMLQVCYAPPPPPPAPEPCPAAGPCELPGIFSVSAGVCLPQFKPDGADCRGDDLCALRSECFAGECVTAKAVECPADSCWSELACDPQTGQCGEPLPDGKECALPDGQAGSCYSAVCWSPQCVNGVVDDGEEGIDCGGVCPPCDPGRD
ncbi:MAG: DNRLRE domain-containing protein [Polyangiaceae bacterium]